MYDVLVHLYIVLASSIILVRKRDQSSLHIVDSSSSTTCMYIVYIYVHRTSYLYIYLYVRCTHSSYQYTSCT